MEGFTAIQFDGHFYANIVQGTYELLTEVNFTATLNYDVADSDKFDTMFGGQLPVDIIKKDASRAAEMTYTKLFAQGCTIDELKYKADTQAALILQDLALADWEARAGIRATAINNVHIEIDSETEKLLLNISAMNSVSVSAPKSEERWKCTCGNMNSGKFCTECGTKKPEDWVCSCGNVNKGRFCTECGTPKNV